MKRKKTTKPSPHQNLTAEQRKQAEVHDPYLYQNTFRTAVFHYEGNAYSVTGAYLGPVSDPAA